MRVVGKTDFGIVLHFLADKFGGKMLLSVSDVARVFRIDRRTAENRFPFDENHRITLPNLAAALCAAPRER